jgi:hypothetical protein
MSKIFRTRAYSPKNRSPRRTAWPGAARVKALRPLRSARNAALTQAFLPGPSLRHVGNVQVWLGEASTPKTKTESAEVVVEVAVGTPFRLRRMRLNG